MDNNIEKAVRPEVSKETLLEVIKELQELVIGILEVEDEMSETETEDTELEITPTNPSPIGDPEKNPVNWPVEKTDGQLILNEEERAILEIGGKEPVKKSNHIEDYKSDNEEEDKWDNIEKACWTGYKQEGMKEKNGRMVPNCVPVEKSSSPWGGAFTPKVSK